MQIPPIKITSKGETFYINRDTSSTIPRPSINEEQGCAVINEIDMETTQNNDENYELTHHEDSWKVVTSSKKRKVTPCISCRKAIVADKQQWLQEINLRNSFSALPEERVTDSVEKPITGIAKPPPIYMDAEIIDPPPLELLNNNAGKLVPYLKQQHKKSET